MNKTDIGLCAVFWAAFVSWLAATALHTVASYSSVDAAEGKVNRESFGQAPEEAVRAEPPSSAAPSTETALQSPAESATAGGASPRERLPSDEFGPSATADGSAGVLSNLTPDYAPSRERFLELSAALYRALALTTAELKEIEPAFWDEFPEYRYLLDGPDETTVREHRAFAWMEPRRDLEVLWQTKQEARQDWMTHQQLYKAQMLGTVSGVNLSATQARLQAVRDAIWSGVGPEHRFLARLDREAR